MAAESAGGHLFLAGSTGRGFPLVNAVQSTFGGRDRRLVAEFGSGGVLLSSTYLGGSGTVRWILVPFDDGSVLV